MTWLIAVGQWLLKFYSEHLHSLHQHALALEAILVLCLDVWEFTKVDTICFLCTAALFWTVDEWLHS